MSTRRPLLDDDLTPTQAADELRKYVDSFYVALFVGGVGTTCHAFIEFCGVMGEYVKICKDLADQGIDFRELNGHHATAHATIPEYRVEYLAEKLGCIFAPMLRGKPELREAFANALFCEVEGAAPAQHSILEDG